MAKYWRSLEEYYEQPSFRDYVEREFPEAASLLPEGVSRRRWLQVMGASLTLAGVAGCRWEDEEIVTYVDRPANRIPGVPVKYATCLEQSGVAVGVLATSYDGRPIKLDINREHPQGFRGTNGQVQASVLSLYDPDRIARDVKTGAHNNLYDPNQAAVLRERVGKGRKARTWDQFESFAGKWSEKHKSNGGQGLRVLSGANSSPSLQRLKAEFRQAFPVAKWVEYEPISRDNEYVGAEMALGSKLRLKYNVAEADVVVGLDSDLLDFHPDALRHVAEWSGRRVPEEGAMNRTYAIESCYSILGQNADHRIPLASSQMGAVLADLRDALQGGQLGGASASEGDAKRAVLDAIVDDLNKHRGRSLVVAGPGQPPEVHAACLQLNSLLGNLGTTVTAVDVDGLDRPTHAEALQELVDELKAGDVQSLVVLGGNPAYDTPQELGLAELIKKVPSSIRLGQSDDETAGVCQWYVPEAHALECWGDGRSWDGTVSIRQPLLSPLHRGRSDIELLALLLQQEQRGGREIVRQTQNGISQSAWDQAIHDGFVADSAATAIAAPQLATGLEASLEEWYGQVSAPSEDNGSAEVVFLPDDSVYDGRFANNAWLQENPSQLTKLTWDNVAVISPQTAKDQGLKDGDVITLTRGEQSVEIPVFQLPGVADNTYGVALGYGRTLAGHVGGSVYVDVDPVGTSAYALMSNSNLNYDRTVSVAKTGRDHVLATTQSHWAIDVAGMNEIGKRVGALVREGTLHEYEEHPAFADHRVHHPELESLWEERHYFDDDATLNVIGSKVETKEGAGLDYTRSQPFSKEYQWGMSIDLARCIGCNACTVSCQAENNVPVVGKDQVSRGREMHWIRIDRYFVTPEDKENEPVDSAIANSANIGVSVQPVTCQQCENAPCEQVCPVAATVHSPEGLNDMAYNRCIGTRYCANNCPYKVRRFNYYSNAIPLMQPEKELVQLVMNPEVTIRSRGVMEKCTYCVQRIQNGKIVAKNERRQLRDGEVQSACQEACPANAITFGNLQDKNSQVSKNHASARSYAMLGELNVKPRTEYMARIRNPHPSLEPDYFLQPGGHAVHEEHGEHGDEEHLDGPAGDHGSDHGAEKKASAH